MFSYDFDLFISSLRACAGTVIHQNGSISNKIYMVIFT